MGKLRLSEGFVLLETTAKKQWSSDVNVNSAEVFQLMVEIRFPTVCANRSKY